MIKSNKMWSFLGLLAVLLIVSWSFFLQSFQNPTKQNEKKEEVIYQAHISDTLAQITLSKRAQELAQIEVSPVVRKEVTISTPLYGTIDYDERLLFRIAAWMAGRIDDLYVDYLGSVVQKGEAIALIYSPELITAQSELIESKRSLKYLNETTLAFIKRSSNLTKSAAFKKLALLGINEEQISKIMDQDSPSDHLTLHAPIGGTVIDLRIREGMYVKTGDSLYAISDLSQLWLICEAYESDLVWIKYGKKVEFEVEAYPGKKFTATVTYIDPMVNEKTRTIRVRLDVPNPENLLKPGMFVKAVQRTLLSNYQDRIPLVIPASAPLITGTRAIVYVEVPEKKWTYEGRVIVLGPKAGDYYIVKEGLQEGEVVVTKGNFKIDSAVQILAKPSMMNPVGDKDVVEEIPE